MGLSHCSAALKVQRFLENTSKSEKEKVGATGAGSLERCAMGMAGLQGEG